MVFQPGDVILLPFPFRDRLAESTRPAVVISTGSYNANGDVIVAAVTSHSPRSPMDVGLSDWQAANLKVPSTVRMLLATVAHSRVVYYVGHLSTRGWEAVQSRLRSAVATA
jgi:mRNA interferase MazF